MLSRVAIQGLRHHPKSVRKQHNTPKTTCAESIHRYYTSSNESSNEKPRYLYSTSSAINFYKRFINGAVNELPILGTNFGSQYWGNWGRYSYSEFYHEIQSDRLDFYTQNLQRKFADTFRKIYHLLGPEKNMALFSRQLDNEPFITEIFKEFINEQVQKGDLVKDACEKAATAYFAAVLQCSKFKQHNDVYSLSNTISEFDKSDKNSRNEFDFYTLNKHMVNALRSLGLLDYGTLTLSSHLAQTEYFKCRKTLFKAYAYAYAHPSFSAKTEEKDKKIVTPEQAKDYAHYSILKISAGAIDFISNCINRVKDLLHR